MRLIRGEGGEKPKQRLKKGGDLDFRKKTYSGNCTQKRGEKGT